MSSAKKYFQISAYPSKHEMRLTLTESHFSRSEMGKAEISTTTEQQTNHTLKWFGDLLPGLHLQYQSGSYGDLMLDVIAPVNKD